MLGDGRDLSMTEVRQLQRMEWALKETERLHPVAFVLMRKAAETLTWQGFRIPPGYHGACGPVPLTSDARGLSGPRPVSSGTVLPGT